MPTRNRAKLAALPRGFVPEVVADLDTTTESGLVAARLRTATYLSKCLKESTLLAAWRARGIRHIACGHQAAFALAALALPVADRRH